MGVGWMREIAGKWSDKNRIPRHRIGAFVPQFDLFDQSEEEEACLHVIFDIPTLLSCSSAAFLEAYALKKERFDKAEKRKKGGSHG